MARALPACSGRVWSPSRPARTAGGSSPAYGPQPARSRSGGASRPWAVPRSPLSIPRSSLLFLLGYLARPRQTPLRDTRCKLVGAFLVLTTVLIKAQGDESPMNLDLFQ